MNVTLTPELEEYVAEKVAAGTYESASEMVHEALRALREKEAYERKRAALIADIQEGIDSLDRGEGIRTSAKQILAEARERRANQ